MRLSRSGTILAASLLLGACDDSSSPSAPPPASPHQALLDALFAPATTAETTAVAAEWAARRPEVDGARIDEEGRFAAELPFLVVSFLKAPSAWSVPDTVPVRLLSHVVDGFRHHGALWTPEGTERLPILVFAHGGDDGIDSIQWRAVLQATRPFRDSIAILAPSFRSEPVGILSRPRSEGDPSPWDRDIEDLRSFVRAAAHLDPRLDTNRICLAGYSRGGGVALLTAQRDPLFASVATIAAPTTFQGPWVRALADSILSGTNADLPGVDHLASTVLLPYQQGRLSLDSARRELIRRSATTWVRRLPPQVVLHHGMSDITVPHAEMERLLEAAHAVGLSPTTRSWPNLDHYMVVPKALDELTVFIRGQLLR